MSPAEIEALTVALTPVLQQQAASAIGDTGRLDRFLFPRRDDWRRAPGRSARAIRAWRKDACSARPFLSPGLQANRNSADRAALPLAMREACNRLAAFHHASIEPWSPQALPAMLPQR